MSYFVGNNLARKIQEFDLEDLDKLLARVVVQEEDWPGTFAVPAPPELLESLRIVLYSLLHKYGIKDEFVVKMQPAKHHITIGLKTEIQKKRAGGIQLIGTPKPADQFSIPVEEQQNAEDLMAIFEEEPKP